LIVSIAILSAGCATGKEGSGVTFHIRKHCGFGYTIERIKVYKVCGPYVKEAKAFGLKFEVKF